MKRFFFYPLWEIDKLEKRLQDYESVGWRLSKISFPFIFGFERESPRESRYFTTYDLMGDYVDSLFDTEQELLSHYSANKIEKNSMFCNIFRITCSKTISGEIIQSRNRYFLSVLRHRLFYSLAFLFPGLLMLFSLFFRTPSVMVIIMMCVYTVTSVFFSLYYTYGCRKHRLHMKNGR